MNRPRFEIADLLRTLLASGRLADLAPLQHKVVRALVRCRTAALGGHIEACDDCGAEINAYNSCRNRHCPKCQGSAAEKWLVAQQQCLLPVPNAHVVFTLPDLLAPLALQNPRVLYDLLFRAASRALLEIAADSQHLGARLGILAILHTWGQQLVHHPHLHCLIPAGGPALDSSRWIACRPGFFLPVRVLSRRFRTLFLALLDEAYRAGDLQFHGRLHTLAKPRAFSRLLAQARSAEWVVYANPPFGGPDLVLHYLGRYTHRVAFSNHRILDISGDTIRFTWKDYRRGHHRRVMSLDTGEFARRFLLHVLPERFVKIRYYGFLAPSQRKHALQHCRGLLLAPPPPAPPPPPPPSNVTPALSAPDATGPRCPHCKRGTLRRVRILPAFDSS